jgi:hypothetical protein
VIGRVSIDGVGQQRLWLAATETELYGFADTQEVAYRAMQVAIRQARTSPPTQEGDS